jgi:hypothetical protein
MTSWRFIIVPVVAILCGAHAASAQPSSSRFEIGAHATLLRLSDFDRTNPGIGGRLSFDLAKGIALEAEGTFFPEDDVVLPPGNLDLRIRYTRRRADAFFGIKAGLAGERMGLFAKVRPGFTRLSARGRLGDCTGVDCALVLLVRPEYRTEFALDFGGVFEFYPSARTVARVEVGDTIIRHRSVAPPCWGSTCTSHNLSTGLGFGVRFR